MSVKTQRTVEQRVEEIEAKLAFHKKHIAELEAKKTLLLNPKPKQPKITAKLVLSMAQENGMTPEDIAKKLGLKI